MTSKKSINSATEHSRVWRSLAVTALRHTLLQLTSPGLMQLTAKQIQDVLDSTVEYEVDIPALVVMTFETLTRAQQRALLIKLSTRFRRPSPK